ncbi:MAG: glutathione S-transferase N-terminal domain-containing protein [Candidatus Sericytochromatia bacterium]|nr:glutathione S-transferase N-terminal domain-containing protein [Candidatus Sericytochromatia bacterium]
MKLYNLERCPYCKLVRDKLAALGLTYEKVEVPGERSARQEVFDVSGQWTVPVLVDGEVMLDDEEKILPYLDSTYGQAPR